MSKDERNLFLAITFGKVHRLHSILQQDTADVNVRDVYGRTPLTHALFLDKPDIRAHIVRMLLRANCDVNAIDKEQRTALMYACMEEDKADVVRLLCRAQTIDVNMRDKDGYTALMHAVTSGNLMAMRTLIHHANVKAKLNVNARSSQGLTALQLAVKLRLSQACKVLVHEACADTTKVKENAALLQMLQNPEDRIFSPYCNTPQGMLSPRPCGTPLYLMSPSPTSMFGQREKSDMQRQKSDLLKRSYFQSSSRTSSLSPRQPPAPANNDINGRYGWLKSPLQGRRPLTPISPRAGDVAPPPPVHIGHTPRLPSIPSGKKLFLVSPRASPMPVEKT